MSLANPRRDGPKDVADLLINTIDLAYHPNLMGAAGGPGGPDAPRPSTTGLHPGGRGRHPDRVRRQHLYTLDRERREVTAPGAVTELAARARCGACHRHLRHLRRDSRRRPNPTGVKSVSALSGRVNNQHPRLPDPPGLDRLDHRPAAGRRHAVASTPPAGPTELFGARSTSSCPSRDQAGHNLGPDRRLPPNDWVQGQRTYADCPTRGGTTATTGASAPTPCAWAAPRALFRTVLALLRQCWGASALTTKSKGNRSQVYRLATIVATKEND